jgi:hypothetical protein
MAALEETKMKAKKLRKLRKAASPPEYRTAGHFIDHRRRTKPRSLNEALATGWKVRERMGLFSPDDQLESGVEVIENHDHTVKLEVPFNVVTIYGTPHPPTKAWSRGR